MNENRDLHSESIGVRHEAKDGKDNEAGKQRSDLIAKTKVFVGDVTSKRLSKKALAKRGHCDGDG